MPVGSHAPFRVAMLLLSGGRVIPLRAQDYLQSLTIELTGQSAWTGSATLFDQQGDFLENLIIAAGTDRALEVRFGRTDDLFGESATFRGNITTYKPEYTNEGVTLQMDLVTQGILDVVLDRRILSFVEGRKISDIFTEIAAARGWATSDALGRTTIEPTRDVVKEPFTSNGESDLAFIRRMLLPQAVNVDGVGNYQFYFDETNAVHFHTVDFLSPPEHEFVFMRAGGGDVISFAPQDASLFGVLMGGGNTVFGGASSLAGAPMQANSSTTGGIANAGFPALSDSGSRVPLGDGTQAYVDFPTRDPEEFARLAQARYDKYREYGYAAQMEVVGTHRVRLNDIANVRYLKKNPAAGTSPEHYLSGRFRVLKIAHTVDTSGWRTTFQMLRGGLNLPSASPVQATPVITPPQASTNAEGIGLAVETMS